MCRERRAYICHLERHYRNKIYRAGEMFAILKDTGFYFQTYSDTFE